MLSRRAFFGFAAALPIAAAEAPYALSRNDEAFLEDLSRRAFLYFWEQADPATGLVLDRALNGGQKTQGRSREVASMATTGFGLTALCIGHQRQWSKPDEIVERVRTTLRHLANAQTHERGWFYHFVDMHTGDRVWKCELSTIDTALLLAGVLTAQQYFESDADIVSLCQRIYGRVDFHWMLDEATGYLRMGWRPESGFLRSAWVNYRENAILHVLAIGSPVHAIPLRSWYAFERDPVIFEDYRYVGGGPLFTHQFSQAWLDFRGLRDGAPYRIDYFRNSVVATLAHRAFCLSLRSLYPSYSENLWGITPSDSQIGYVGWGNAFSRRDIDGTVVPCAAGGSLMFTPSISLAALQTMRAQFGEHIYGHYGFADAFHPLSLWVDSEVVGIDLGITLLSAENLRTGGVWKWFNRQPNVRWALDRIFEPSSS